MFNPTYWTVIFIISVLTPKMTFEHVLVSHKAYPIEEMLKDKLGELRYASTDPDAHIAYIANSIALLHIYRVPQLVAFHFYIVKKYVLLSNSYVSRKFNLQVEMEQPEVKKALSIWKEYSTMSSTEIWDIRTFSALTAQISYEKTIGCFENENDESTLLNCLSQLINEIEEEAAVGYKNGLSTAKFELYNHELQLADDITILTVYNHQTVYQMYYTINIIMCNDATYANQSTLKFNNLLKVSTSIGSTNPKNRKQFFKQLREKLELI